MTVDIPGHGGADLLTRLAESVCLRSNAVQNGDPVVRYAAVSEAWHEAAGPDAGLTRRRQIKLQAAAVSLARRIGFESARLRSPAFEQTLYRPDYRPIRSPVGVLVAVEAAGLVVVRDDPMRILAAAFIGYLLRKRVRTKRRAMHKAWAAIRPAEREFLNAAVDEPVRTATRVACAAGLNWKQMVSSATLLEEIVSEGEVGDGSSNRKLSELRKQRLSELPRRRELSNASDNDDDEYGDFDEDDWASTPEDYAEELRGQREADYEDRAALADNLSGMNPNEFE